MCKCTNWCVCIFLLCPSVDVGVRVYRTVVSRCVSPVIAGAQGAGQHCLIGGARDDWSGCGQDSGTYLDTVCSLQEIRWGYMRVWGHMSVWGHMRLLGVWGHMRLEWGHNGVWGHCDPILENPTYCTKLKSELLLVMDTSIFAVYRMVAKMLWSRVLLLSYEC